MWKGRDIIAGSCEGYVQRREDICAMCARKICQQCRRDRWRRGGGRGYCVEDVTKEEGDELWKRREGVASSSWRERAAVLHKGAEKVVGGLGAGANPHLGVGLLP